jgi:hypothetical protein
MATSGTDGKSGNPPAGGGAGGHAGGPTDPSHDENLRRGILFTAVSRPVAAMLVGAFLATIYAIPIVQAVRDQTSGEESILRELFRRAPTRENLRQFEDDLEKASAPREWVRPRMQEVLTRHGGYGNSKAIIGRDGWLYYAPGVTAVGGAGFLHPALIASRQKDALDAGEPPVHPDPRPAILSFARYLGGRGIRLVFFPVPDKASLQPVELHGRGRSIAAAPARNADTDRLVRELEQAGVLVFDANPAVLRAGEPPRFLVQDTHWNPGWMESVAAELGRFLVARGVVAPAPTGAVPRFRVQDRTVTRLGDVADMLALGEGQTLFRPLTVAIHEVDDDKGAPFESNEKASVLLLGDSFTNVFTLEQMGWGVSAGLGPHLARALDRDVDVIARNDAGAHATRQLLFNALAGGEDRLAGKTVVIWELASRELAVGDFKPVDWDSLARPGAGAAPATGQEGGQ